MKPKLTATTGTPAEAAKMPAPAFPAKVTVIRDGKARFLVDSKAFDEALAQLGKPFPAEFAALAADRKGDVFLLQGKKAEARAEFEKAFKAFDAGTEYRRLVEVKLNALGANPQVVLAGTVTEAKK